MKKTSLITALILACTSAVAVNHRSTAARHAFQRQHPCPSTSQPRGSCPGYTIDHVVPLCAGGPDTPANMQWQTVADAKVKDRDERKQCARKVK